MDKQKIKTYLERIIQLEDEKKELNRDIKQVYANATNDGVDETELKMAVKLSKMKRKERDALKTVDEILD